MVFAMPAASTGLITEGLRRTVTALAAPASRVTGYPGAESAERWLTAELQRMGVGEIYRHPFPVPIPIDQGFRLAYGAESLELFGLWPNLVRTPTIAASGDRKSVV